MPNGGAVMSVLLGDREAKVQAFDLSGQPLSAAKRVETGRGGSAAILDSCLAAASSHLNSRDAIPVQLVATGVALDEDAPDLEWPEYFGGRPVVVDSVLGAVATAEALSRTPRPQNMLFLDVGKTIDCAVLVHGRTLGVLRTSKGAFGHTPVKGTSAKSTSVPACACGITNCLQAIAGEEAIIASLSSDSKDEPDAISDAVRRADAAAVSVLRQAGRDIGDTLLGSIHLLRPDVITVRTRWLGATDLLLAGLKEAVYAGGAPAVTENLVLASSRNRSPATGIALRAMDAGLAVEPVNRLLSAAPGLSGQQICRPAPRKSTDHQRTHLLTGPR
ncbi:Sugar kinase of the NBD/HSP70 family, may contain an N-terminal HTH domain [Arthrobacter sp. ok909]|nr:Sugar kinase of the NBD/HSP70 family, may contain an N-terminal HTH domain [Arthrobacter sp. ok909]